MHLIYTMLKKELNSFFSSLMAYVIISFFLSLIGLWIWVFPTTNVLDEGYADLQTFFYIAPYLFMFLMPAVTMHLLAEERRMGTLELLLATPLSITQIVVGKYLASLFIVALILLLTAPYYFSIYQLGSPPGNIDTAAVIGSYTGLLLLASLFAAIGLFVSSLTEHQLIAFLVGSLLCFFLYQGFEVWTALQPWESYALILTQMGIRHHYEALSRGVIDTRDVLYFFALISLFLWGTGLAVTRRR